MIKTIFGFAEIGIDEHCENPETKELLLEFMDQCYEILEYFSELNAEFKEVEAKEEYGSIEQCMVLTDEEYFNGDYN